MVSNIWTSTMFLYLGDVMMVALVFSGVVAAIAAALKHQNKFIILDLTYEQMRGVYVFMIGWLFVALVAFKFIILQGGPNFTHSVGTGSHGSVQFSTAGELCAFLLAGVGAVHWLRAFRKHVRLTSA